jgi:hypothetical protein
MSWWHELLNLNQPTQGRTAHHLVDVKSGCQVAVSRPAPHQQLPPVAAHHFCQHGSSVSELPDLEESQEGKKKKGFGNSSFTSPRVIARSCVHKKATRNFQLHTSLVSPSCMNKASLSRRRQAAVAAAQTPRQHNAYAYLTFLSSSRPPSKEGRERSDLGGERAGGESQAIALPS